MRSASAFRLAALLVGALAGCGATSGESAPSSDASSADASPTFFPGSPPATIGMGGPPPSAQGDNGGAIADADTADGPCAVGERCNTSCSDVNGDPANCGACDRACGDGSVCSDGLCQAACGAGLTSCSGACVDLTTSTSNCGACGAPCDAGWSCQNGQCVCPGMTCQGRCVDPTSDPENCGGYGCAFVLTGAGSLPPGFMDAYFAEIQQFCNDGMCQNYCSLGKNVCGRSCVFTGHDSNKRAPPTAAPAAFRVRPAWPASKAPARSLVPPVKSRAGARASTHRPRKSIVGFAIRCAAAISFVPTARASVQSARPTAAARASISHKIVAIAGLAETHVPPARHA
jgi:hypothetical protein